MEGGSKNECRDWDIERGYRAAGSTVSMKGLDSCFGKTSDRKITTTVKFRDFSVLRQQIARENFMQSH